MSPTPSRRELANAVRALSMDAVQRANSGHPGMPMGMADIAEVLWRDYLRHNPANPRWSDRDRFVLSNGHGSMLLYSLLHLTGYELPLEELQQFRQLGYRTAGHPEYDLDIGIETTTGPLGQGLANAVGMAIAERVLAATFNRPGYDIVDHYTYVFLGDGCLMEGVSHEACSLAGTLKLGKLIAFYDDNGISIDGDVRGWFTDDTPKRFEAYGWHVIPDVDGHDWAAVKRAIEIARAADKPTLICCRTVIGYGAPNKQGTEETHGAALGEAEVAAARERLGWPHPPFVVPEEIRAAWDARSRGAELEERWRGTFAEYRRQYPELAAEYQRRMRGELPDGWAGFADELLQRLARDGKPMATRKASQVCLDAYGPMLPELIGGSADLTGSNNTWWSGSKAVSAEQPAGNYIYFGVREFAMSAVLNGLRLHDGLVAYGGTFLTFSDYARSAVRMAALIGVPSIFVYSHDSIGLGEDGPTHQPIEHLASLRIVPNMTLWRPCDVVETAVAWRAAIEQRGGPTALALTRQNLPFFQRDAAQLAAIGRGGYALRDCEDPDVVLIATGSEVGLAVEACDRLQAEGRAVRVVSIPCTSRFDAQDAAWREAVLGPAGTPRVAIEAGVSEYWHRYVGPGGRIIGIDRYGESAPGQDVFEHFGFTADNVVRVVEELLETRRRSPAVC